MSLLSRFISFARAFTRTPLFVALAKTISKKLHSGGLVSPVSPHSSQILCNSTFMVHHRLILRADNFNNPSYHFMSDPPVPRPEARRALPPARRRRHPRIR